MPEPEFTHIRLSSVVDLILLELIDQGHPGAEAGRRSSVPS